MKKKVAISKMKGELQFDLNQLSDLRKPVNHIMEMVQSRKPSECIFLWSGQRILTKQASDLQSQRNIIEALQNAAEMARASAHAQAELYSVPQTTQDILDGKEAERRLNEEKQKKEIKELQAQQARADYEIAKAEIDKEILGLEKEEKQLENDLLRAKRADKDSYRRLIDKATEFFDQLPEHLKAFVTISVQNPNQEISDEMMMLDQLKDFVAEQRKADLQEKQAQANKLEQQAKQEKALADIKSTSAEQARKEFEDEYEDRGTSES